MGRVGCTKQKNKRKKRPLRKKKGYVTRRAKQKQRYNQKKSEKNKRW